MSKNSNNISSGGIGFPGFLTIVFIVLKLTGVINWSWVWVLSPIWFSFLFVEILLIIVIFAVMNK